MRMFAPRCRLLLPMLVISPHGYHYHDYHSFNPSSHHEHHHHHYPQAHITGRGQRQKGRGWSRYDDRAKSLGGSMAVSVLFWVLYSRRFHSGGPHIN